MLEITLILGVGWFAVAVIAIALGRVAARADRRTEEAMRSSTEVTAAQVAAVRARTLSSPRPALHRSKIRIGPA